MLDALVVPAALLHEIAARATPIRALAPVPCADGRMVLSADLLTDCGPGQTWADYADILLTLARETVAMPVSEGDA